LATAALCGAVADDACLTLRGRFKNVQAGFGHRGQGGASGFAQDEGGLQVLGVKQPFDGANRGAVLGGNLPQSLQDLQKAPRTFPTRRTGDEPQASATGCGLAILITPKPVPRREDLCQ